MGKMKQESKMDKATIKDLKFDTKNANKHTEKGMRLLEKSLSKLGAGRSILLDKDNNIIAGNGVIEVAGQIGLENIKIIETDGNEIIAVKRKDVSINSKKGRELALADNQTAKVGIDFDFEVIDDLANEFDLNLKEWEFEPLVFDTKLEASEDDYEVTEAEAIQTNIVLGDLIEFKKDGQTLHRLMCGDSTDSEQVAKLMNGNKADMVFIDPPYDLDDVGYAVNIFLFSENAHVFVMHDDRGIVNYLRNSKLDFLRFYVANFGFSSPRGNDPYLQHILISQEKHGDAMKHQNLHDGLASIIPLEYRFRLKDEHTIHKHQKPISFVAKFINHFSIINQTILDLFLGSGTTMVAAHQLDRKCYGMEIDPIYCQVIIDRMLKLDSNLEVNVNGKQYK
jgi:hypothetical protein